MSAECGYLIPYPAKVFVILWRLYRCVSSHPPLRLVSAHRNKMSQPMNLSNTVEIFPSGNQITTQDIYI